MNMREARRFLLEKEQKESEMAENRFLEAEKAFSDITQYIIAHYHPHEIRKCGSLLFKDVFNVNSDIDIGLRGIEFRSLLELFLHFEAITPHRVHLIDIDDLNESDKKVLMKYSEIVYKAPEVCP